MGVMEFCIVRNNVYQLYVKGIRAWAIRYLIPRVRMIPVRRMRVMMSLST